MSSAPAFREGHGDVFAWTSSPTNSRRFLMMCLLFADFIIGDAAPAVLPHLRQGSLHRAQPATSQLRQAHHFPSQKTLCLDARQP